MTGRDLDREARLRTLEAALFDASPDVQLLCDLDGTLLARNAAARELGESTRLADLFADPVEIEGLRERNFLGADQVVLRLVDGRQVMIAVAPVAVDDGRCWEVVLHDVTTHALLGDDLQVARQLAAVGRLGRLVNHEITSPLAVLLGRIELLQTLGAPPPELLARHLDVMGEHARRIATVLQDLDALAVGGQGRLTPVALGPLLQSVRDDQAVKLGDLALTVDVDPRDLTTSGHSGRLYQVFTTLLLQLASGMGKGAGLSIHVRARETEIVVAFLGHASPRFPDVRQRILDSWSADTEAQDLGAAVAMSILVAHAGRLQATSDGAGLEVVLPARGPAVAVDRGLRVLFVDDDATTVAVTLDMLSSLGHQASGVSSAEQALVALQAETFDAVVTDLVLPGLSGLGLREEIAQRWPGLEQRVVLVSGARQAPPEAVCFVPKPYTRTLLQEALQRVVGTELFTGD